MLGGENCRIEQHPGGCVEALNGAKSSLDLVEQYGEGQSVRTSPSFLIPPCTPCPEGDNQMALTENKKEKRIPTPATRVLCGPQSTSKRKETTMFCHIDRPRSMVRTAFALLYIVTGALTTATAAQDTGQPEKHNRSAIRSIHTGRLILWKSVIDTENDGLGLTTASTSAFHPISLACPSTHTAGCTIKVEVSSQFWNVPSSSVAQVSVSVTGGLGVNPASVVNVDSTTTGGLATVHTFQWMIGSVPAGTSQTVNISFDVSSGTAEAGYRTATIQIFLN
jgi:hypothetical protein